MTLAGWPMRMCRSCTSLKLASTRMRSSGTIAIKRRPGGDVIAELHAALGDVAGDRRAHAGALEVEPGALHLGGRRLHVGVVGDAGVPDERGARGETLLRGGEGVLGGLELIARVPEFLPRDRAAGGEVLAAVEVGLRAVQVRAALPDHRGQLVAVGEYRARLAHGARQLLLGVIERDARIGGIEPDEFLPGLDQVGLVGADADYGAGHLRHDVHQVAGDVGIVGVLVVTGVQAATRRRPRAPPARVPR